MNKNSSSKTLIDFLMYFMCTIIPMIIGIFSVPIMTRYFSPEEYGVNSIVDSTFSYFNCLTFAILGSICWRFYYRYKNEEKTQLFLNYLFTLFFLYTCVITVFTTIFIVLEHELHVKFLILLKYFVTVLSGWVSVEIIVIRHNGESVKYSLITSLIVILDFAFLYILTYVLKLRNEALYISSIIIYTPLFLFLFLKRKYKIINVFKNKDTLKEFLSFAYYNVATSFLTVVLLSSDRYMIKYFCEGYEAVGIYSKAYGIGERIIYSLATMFFNVYNPIIYKTLSDKNTEQEKIVFSRLINLYLLFMLPITLVFSMFSKYVVMIFLGSSFQVGYIIIPFVAFGYFLDRFSCSLFGVAINFKNVRLNLIGVSIATFINIILNYLLIPLFGIVGGALATLAAYLFIFLYSCIVSGYFKIHFFILNKYYFVAYLILIFYVVSHFMVKLKFKENLLCLIINAVLFAIIYYLYIFFCVKHSYIRIQKSNV